MDTRAMEQLIGEMRSTAQTAGSKQAGVQPTTAESPNQVDFAQVLQNTLQDVSSASMEARAMAEEFSAGNPDVKLQDVMVNLEKASLSFQQMTEVRNRLVSAYQDIMNMPV